MVDSSGPCLSAIMSLEGGAVTQMLDVCLASLGHGSEPLYIL